MKDKPPEFYKCKKIILRNIVSNKETLRRINDAVLRTNKTIIRTYQFIKAYSLFQFSKVNDIPIIDENFIGLCFKVIAKGDGRGNKLGYSNQIIFDKLNNFYIKEFEQTLTNKTKPSSIKLNQILRYYKTSIITAFENNIKMHFFERLFKYINVVFEDNNEKTKNDTKNKLRKVKNDIINNTLKSDIKYHKWIEENRYKLVPKDFKKSYHYDIKCNPQKYLKHLIYMNNELEKINKTLFHCFPLRNDIVPKYIEIDTNALIELTIDEGSKKYRNGKGIFEKSKPILWSNNFTLNSDDFKYNKDYTFDYTILTDSIGATIRFVHKNYYGKTKPKSKIKDNIIEFPYIDEISDEELNKIKNNDYSCVYIDPNKGNLIYCIDDNNETFRYTRKQRIRETQRVKHNRTLMNYKKQHNLTKLETEISKYNSKTTKYDKFIEYLQIKNKINEELYKYYEVEFIRKLKLRRFINTQRSESKLINNFKEKYSKGKDIVIFYGDCNVGKQMRNIISTPMIGMKRLLSKNFKVYNIDEFRTSCLDWRTEERNENTYVMKDYKRKKLHSVLVSKIPIAESGKFYISHQNRDRNSVYNIRKIVKQYLKDKTRPYRYRRDIEIPKEKPYKA